MPKVRATGIATLLLLAAVVCVQADGPAEKRKIESLIKSVESLKGAKFVRNDKEYDASAAARFLRGKWEAREASIKSADDFIEKVGSVSSTSGKPYQIRFKDGKELKSGDYLRAELKKLENPER